MVTASLASSGCESLQRQSETEATSRDFHSEENEGMRRWLAGEVVNFSCRKAQRPNAGTRLLAKLRFY